MKHLIIIGVGGFAREVHWHAQGSIGYGEEWDIKGFLDGDIKLEAREYEKLPLPLLGDVESYEVQPDEVFVCSIADCAARERLVGILERKGAEFINLIHRTALVAPTATMGVGCIVTPDCKLMPDTRIGNHVIMNIAATLGHDAQAGDFCSMMGSSGLMGYAMAGQRVYLGTAASALPHAILEDDVFVGEWSVVFKRARRGRKVFGNPALPIDE